MTTSQSIDNPTKPSATPDMQSRLQAVSKTVKINTDDLDFEAKLPAGNAILQNQTTVTFTLMDTDIVLTAQIAARLIIGRHDFDSGDQVDIDLMPYDGREKGVSRRHATLYRTAHTILLVDLNSSNGTYVNSTRLIPHQPRLLRDGDEIFFGNMKFRIHFDD